MQSLEKFIEAYPNFKETTIQTFDDKQQDKSLAQKFATKNVDWDRIKELNNKGAGIFFSVNSMREGERSKDAVEKINTWIVESDELSKEEQQKLIKKAPLQPSAIVESKKSYHIYYFSKDGDKETREFINRGLREYYHGDKAICSDTSRVLRLPGFNHNKQEPYPVNCIFIKDNYYTKQEMMSAFPYKEEKKLKSKPKASFSRYENIRELMSSQDTTYMLQRISGTSIVDGEYVEFKRNSDGTEQIWVGGKSTGAWIDRQGYIGSGDNGGPTWIQWVVRYGKSKSEVLKWFREYCSDLIPKEFNNSILDREYKKQQQEDVIEKQEKDLKESFRHIEYKDKIEMGIEELLSTDPNKIMKRGWEEWDSLLGGIYGGKIYLVGAETGEGKTTFINQIANNLSQAGVRITRYSLEDRIQDNAKEELFYTINRIRSKELREKLKWIPFVNGEYTTSGHKNEDDSIRDDLYKARELLTKKAIIELDKTRDIRIDELITLMNTECDKGTKVFFIDHLHYFSFDLSKERQDLEIESAMKKINELARKRNVAVFLIAHYNAKSRGSADVNTFKGSTGIKQIANIIIQLERYDDITNFVISKLRGPIKKQDIEARFDLQTYEYTFTKTGEQKEKEKKSGFLN